MGDAFNDFHSLRAVFRLYKKNLSLFKKEFQSFTIMKKNQVYAIRRDSHPRISLYFAIDCAQMQKVKARPGARGI